ncbi:MAG: hypothetical protein GX616_19740 [Planctomycetes bacterium]|nr:hypothetical protein [Planctomycetota bacterium]
MRTGLLCSCVCILACAGVAQAGLLSYEFQPTPADLYDLDHSYAYKWGLNWSPPDNAPVVAATLEIENLKNWAVEPNILYIHLLDSAKAGVTRQYDNRSGDWYQGQGIRLTTFTDTRTSNSQPAVDWSYTFTAQDLAVLNTYVADGKFGLGFDPDCHYYNDGVKLTLVVEHTPEPAMLALLGAPLPLLFARRRQVGTRKQS